MKTILISIGTLVLIGGSVYAYLHWTEVAAAAKKLGNALNEINKQDNIPTVNPDVNAPAVISADDMFNQEVAAAIDYAEKHSVAGHTAVTSTEMNKLITSLKNSREKIMNASLTYQVPMRYIIVYLADKAYAAKFSVHAVDMIGLLRYNLTRLDTSKEFGVTSGRGGETVLSGRG